MLIYHDKFKKELYIFILRMHQTSNVNNLMYNLLIQFYYDHTHTINSNLISLWFSLEDDIHTV